MYNQKRQFKCYFYGSLPTQEGTYNFAIRGGTDALVTKINDSYLIVIKAGEFERGLNTPDSNLALVFSPNTELAENYIFAHLDKVNLPNRAKFVIYVEKNERVEDYLDI